jgi:hypothetical protein
VPLLADDELLVRGPYEGRRQLAERLGWHFELDEDTGGFELTPLTVPGSGAAERPWER